MLVGAAAAIWGGLRGCFARGRYPGPLLKWAAYKELRGRGRIMSRHRLARPPSSARMQGLEQKHVQSYGRNVSPLLVLPPSTLAPSFCSAISGGGMIPRLHSLVG